jgi:hypothetical protein
MAKKKTASELSPEAIAANTAGEARREKEKQNRQRNAEKQKRFRDNMKRGGFYCFNVLVGQDHLSGFSSSRSGSV